MNLSAKSKKLGALFLGLFFLNSCEELGPFGLGEDDIAPLEFLTTEVATTGEIVLVDSIVSIGTGTLLTGDRSMPFGEMRAKAHTAFYYDQFSLRRPSDEARLDSVKLNLRFNYIFENNDQGVGLDLKAYQTEGEFRDTTLYFTTSTRTVTDVLIAENNLVITDLDSTYSLAVDETWSALVFDALGDPSNPLFQSLANFRGFLPGLAFQSDELMDNMFGIETGENIEIAFYYSEPSADGSGLTDNREFVLSGRLSPHFYSLDVDRSATEYSQVQDPAIAYPPTNNLLVHSGAGVVSKIDMSELRDFSEEEVNSIVNLVEFEVGPIEVLPNGVDPPEALFLHFTDDENTTIADRGAFRGIQVDSAPLLATQFPVRLTYNPLTRTYKNSITTYVQSYYNNVLRRDFILLYPTDMNASASGFEVAPEDVRIKIFYSQLR